MDIFNNEVSEALKATLIAQNKYEQYLATLQKIHEAEQAIRELNVYSLNVTPATMREVSQTLGMATISIRTTYNACDEYSDLYHTLKHITDLCSFTVQLNEAFPCNSIDFNAKMIKRVQFFYEEEWVSNDEGGSEIYLRSTNVHLDLDEDILLALNPQLITDEHPTVDIPQLTELICNELEDYCSYHRDFLHEFGAIYQNQFVFDDQPVSYSKLKHGDSEN